MLPIYLTLAAGIGKKPVTTKAAPANLASDEPVSMLFKVTKLGNIQWYKISVEHKKSYSTVTTEKAIKVGAKSQKDIYKIDSGVNIGKANETTIPEQAEATARSIISRKRDDGYKTAEELGITFTDDGTPVMANKIVFNTDASSNLKPMKISYYENQDIEFPVWVQPKKDGLSTPINNKGVMLSSNGKDVKADLSHISKQLQAMKLDIPNLQGELYIHGEYFEDIVSAVKKTYPLSKKMELWLFDICDSTLTQADRLKLLAGIKESTHVKVMPCYVVNNYDELAAYEKMFVEEWKMEGMIIRQENFYEFGQRSTRVLKWVREHDAEFEIIDTKEATGRDKGTILFVCKTESGEPFDVRPMGTFEHRQKMFKDRKKLVGKMLTVKFRNLTKRGVPRFPTGKAVRDYE